MSSENNRDRSPLRLRQPWLICDRDFCPFGTRHLARLANHKKFHHADGSGFRCPECKSSKTFETLADAIRHGWKWHGGDWQECRHCEEEVADMEIHLKMVHKDLQALTCQICWQKLPSDSSLSQHTPLHLKRQSWCRRCKRNFHLVDIGFGGIRTSSCPTCGTEVTYSSKKIVSRDENREMRPSSWTQIEDIPSTSASAIARDRIRSLRSSTVVSNAGALQQRDVQEAPEVAAAEKEVSPFSLAFVVKLIPHLAVISGVKYEKLLDKVVEASGKDGFRKALEMTTLTRGDITAPQTETGSKKIPWELELFAAVQSNDVNAARRILIATFIQLSFFQTCKENQVKSIFGREEWTWGVDSSLQYAASKGYDELIELMVRSGINVNSVSVSEGNRFTALHLAVKQNLTSTVKLLLNLKANKIQKATLNTLFGTPMQWAASLGNDEMIVLLFKSGDRINNKNMFNGTMYTALHLAVNENRISSVKMLIDLGAKIRHGTLHVPGSPLHLAASKGRNEIIEILLQAGADVNSTTFARCTPLHLAVLENKVATVSLLLKKGADGTKHGEMNGVSGTPLEWARQKGWTEIAKVLIAHELKGDRNLTAQDIKLMPTLEKSFTDALDVQEEISTKKQSIRHIDQEIAEIQQEIGRFRAQMQKRFETKQKLAAEILIIEQSPSYKSEQDIEIMREKLVKIKAVAASLREVVCPDGADVTDKSCSVCFEMPKQVFSCTECENWICGRCRAKLKFCPICRASFAVKPPQRNKTVERVFGIL